MKKTVMLILIAAFCFMLIGCNSKEEDGTAGDNLSKTSSIISNNNRNLFVSEDDEFIYFTDFLTVKKINKMDNSVEEIYKCEDTCNLITILECFEDRLYFLTDQGDFVSMDKDGGNLLKATFSWGESEETLENLSSSATPYVFEKNLYFISSEDGSVYRVDTDTLALELADSAILDQYIMPDKMIFTKRAENGLGRLYVTPVNGDTTLFSAEDESVILNRVNFTNAYVFYIAFKLDDSANASELDSLNLYRVDLDGKNKVLIKEFDLYRDNANIRYDNEYIYLSISGDEYLKINKETLKETNIASVIDISTASYEVSNEKFFSVMGSYYIDSKTGEKVNY